MFENDEVDLAQLPRYQSVTFLPLARQAVYVTLARRLGTLVVALAALIGIPLVDPDGSLANLGNWPKLSLAPIALFTGFFVVLSHRFKGYAVRDHDILYKSGVVRQRQTILPLNRVQHIETHRNAIERQLGLSSLKLYSAGGSSADITIRGLPFETADALREMVLTRIQSEQGQSNG
jgi:uncharacterized protein